jgi:hypothetical protein
MSRALERGKPMPMGVFVPTRRKTTPRFSENGPCFLVFKQGKDPFVIVRKVIERRFRRQGQEGSETMQPDKPRTETEPPAAEEDPRSQDSRREPTTPPIDEDVAGSVNAAVPDPDE